ncbi:MAG: TSUP family transporter [Thermoanaerobaculia bacterium]|nr:TSUP family transporter [Thermoanaerobaculia bacterium]
METLSLDPLFAWPLLFIVGAVTGAINTVAGGGSFLTLPVLIFLGLPAGVANGTNRVGVLMQCAAGTWSFNRDGVLDRRAALWASLPTCAGAIVGTLLAIYISNDAFERVLAFLMLAITLLSFWTPRPVESPEDIDRARIGILAVSFFGVGVYAGFVQAGVGFLILAATTFAGLDLVRGSAVKVLAVLACTVVSLGIFWWFGKVFWGVGIVLGLGSVLGALVAARWAVRKGHGPLRVVVSVAVVVFAVLLWLR